MSDTALTAHNLAHFTGTMTYTRYAMGLILTNGARFLVENGAAWLLDIVAAARLTPEIRKADFESWTLTVDPATGRGTVLCTDGDRGDGPVTFYRQTIEWTDFPLPELSLYVQRDPDLGRIAMLTSEY